MNDLYLAVYDVSETRFVPPHEGFTYGVLILENEKPACVMVVSADMDEKIRFLMEHGNIEVQSLSGEVSEIYYGYVTETKQFFCEELLFPKGDDDDGDDF